MQENKLNVLGDEAEYEFKIPNELPSIILNKKFPPQKLSNYFFKIFKYDKNDGKDFSFKTDKKNRNDLIGKLRKLLN